jgi:hypothetical protein
LVRAAITSHTLGGGEAGEGGGEGGWDGAPAGKVGVGGGDEGGEGGGGESCGYSTPQSHHSLSVVALAVLHLGLPLLSVPM